ncbi:MAG: LicD family protein [Alphaproteobacteria bacterium]|nr:LicD family protein [Alphaproteobacteria bacterium]
MQLYKSIFTLSLLCSLHTNAPCSFSNLDTMTPEIRAQTIQSICVDPNIIRETQQMAKNVTELMDNHHVQSWALFGTLLGAMRQKGPDGQQTGGMIPWDDDIDLCIHEKDMGTLRDRPFRAELQKLNYAIVIHDQVGLQIQSRIGIFNSKTQKTIYPFVDIFMVKLNPENNRYEIFPDSVKKLWPKCWFEPSQLETLQKIAFGKFSLNIPARPEEYLTRQYGQDWKTHAYYYFSHHAKVSGNKKWKLQGDEFNPATFDGDLQDLVEKRHLLHHASQPTTETFTEHNKSYWDHFYPTENLPREPSTFAQFILSQNYLQPGAKVLDLACGNGRDTFAFRANGLEAFGLEQSVAAVGSNLAHARASGIKNEIFLVQNVCDWQAMASFTDYDAIYARFFIHAITQEEQVGFMSYLSILPPQTKVFLEFRTDKDPMYQMSVQKGELIGKTDHYRRYIPFEKFCAELVSCGFDILHAEEKNGLSVAYKQDPLKGKILDDPMLGRLVAIKTKP